MRRASTGEWIWAVIFGAIMFIANILNGIPEARQVLGIYTPTPYPSVPVYSVGEAPFYNPVNASTFVPVMHIKDLTTVIYNEFITPIAVSGERLFFAGYLRESNKGSSPGDTSWRESHVELLCIEIPTGKVIWQDWILEAYLVTDGIRLYTPSENQSDDTGLIAYDLDSGKKLWETYFPKTDKGIRVLWPFGTELFVTVGDHAYVNSYILDPSSGKSKQAYPKEEKFVEDGTLISNGIGLKRNGSGDGLVSAYRIGLQEPIWTYYQEHVISNIAVDGGRAYWITLNGKLIAVDVQTGQVLSKLAFSPRFPQNFDYLNNAPIVAAGNDYVAVYFKDKKQLSVFRFVGSH